MADMDEYDDETALTDYVWFNYRHLMTGPELFGLKSAGDQIPEMAKQLEEHFGPDTWKQMTDWLRKGYPAFRGTVRDRLLREYPDAIEVVRCPECQRIVKTPLARQCLWCRHDWH